MIRSTRVVPVIIGDSLPSQRENGKSAEKFYSYLLLLFKPWRRFTDLHRSGSTWTEAYTFMQLNPYCMQLIANMVVDSECRDAKIDQSVALFTGDPQGDEHLDQVNGISFDGHSLSHLLANDVQLDQAESLSTLGEIEYGEEESDPLCMLTENKAEIYRIAWKHISKKAGISTEQDTFGECIEIGNDNRITIKEHGRIMAQEKKKKRPQVEEVLEDNMPRKRHMCHDPQINVGVLVDNAEIDEVHALKMTKEELIVAIEEIHAEFYLDRNEEQSRAFRIAAEHFTFNTVEQLLLFITGIGGAGKSHVIKAIVAIFKHCGCAKNLLLSAPTGSAAVLINSYTIHALIFLPGGENIRKQAELEAIWGQVHYLILDEVSMVSAELLCQISE